MCCDFLRFFEENILLDKKCQSLIILMQKKINSMTFKSKFLVDLCKVIGEIDGNNWFTFVKPYIF